MLIVQVFRLAYQKSVEKLSVQFCYEAILKSFFCAIYPYERNDPTVLLKLP